MKIFARSVSAVPIVVVLVVAACGSAGTPGWTGNAGNTGGSAAGAGTTNGSGSGGGNSGLVGAGDGSAPSSQGGAVPEGPCSPVGSTRACCKNGIQTCGGNEILTWGPCIDSTGAPADCTIIGDAGCGNTHEGVAISCDAGVPPSDAPPSTPPAICSDPSINNEPEILVGYSPAQSQSVGRTGQIKVWVNDERPPFIAPGEQVDPSTGAVVTPGNRTATAPDGLLWEPAIYFAPQTPQNGGTPFFPQWIKGWFDNGVATIAGPPTTPSAIQVPGMDPPPAGSTLAAKYTGEFIWDVSALGLAPGWYTAVFAVHDGDRDRAIGCISIEITP